MSRELECRCTSRLVPGDLLVGCVIVGRRLLMSSSHVLCQIKFSLQCQPAGLRIPNAENVGYYLYYYIYINLLYIFVVLYLYQLAVLIKC